MSSKALTVAGVAGLLLSTGWIFLARLSQNETGLVSRSGVASPSSSISAAISPPVSSVPVLSSKTQARIPSSKGSEGLAELEAESTLRWAFRKDPAHGYVTKMSDGRLALGGATPEIAALKFLDRFGRQVLGFDPTSAAEPEVLREEETTQVIVPQTLNGLPVYGARGNFIFDSDGNLIYVVSDIYRGPSPPPPSPAFSHAYSSQVARQAMFHFLSSGGNADPSAYPLELFQGRLMYRLVGASVSLVYRYELPLVAPQIGDMEILVDASLGVAVLVQNQTRK